MPYGLVPCAAWRAVLGERLRPVITGGNYTPRRLSRWASVMEGELALAVALAMAGAMAVMLALAMAGEVATGKE